MILWVAIVVLGFTAAWLAWRHFRLIRAVHTYERELRVDPQRATPSAEQLTALGNVVRLLVEDHDQQLSVLLSERDRLAAVLDQMTDGVLIADLQGFIQYSNPAARQLFLTADPLGQSVTEVLRNHKLVEAWQDSRESGELRTESVELPLRQQYLHLIVLPDTHAGGSLLLVQDLTRIRRLETVRQDFVSNVSHEIRTPLASLKALAETLLGGALQDPEAGPRFLQRMVAEVDALAQMSQELLELSAIESGKADLVRVPVRPAELLDAAAERMRPQVDRAGLLLRSDCPQELPRIFADSARLEQVLVNLIHNAIKFTSPGGEVLLRAQLEVGGPPAMEMRRGEAPAIRFSVTDTGRGISADDLPRIFERFYRGDKSRAKGGAGLGLSIARHVVEAHGGRIWAESIEGQGSTFSFTVPILG